MEDTTMLEKMAQLLKLQKEVSALQNGTATIAHNRAGIKKKNGVLYMPKNASGKSLLSMNDMTEEERNRFKAKNLRNRAAQLRATAEWNLKEAEKHDKLAQDLDPDSVADSNAQLLYGQELETLNKIIENNAQD